MSFPTSMTSMTLTNPGAEAQTIAQDTITLPYKNPKILLLMNNSGNARYISSVVSTNGYTVNIIANCPQSYGGGCCIAEIIGNAGDSVTLKTTGSWTMRSGAYGWIPQ